LNQKEYERIIEKTVIPGLNTAEEQEKGLNDLQTYINKQLPKRLYRYRTCSERNFDAFLYDKLWFASGNSMNDDFDARLYFDRKEIKKWMGEFLKQDREKKLLGQIYQTIGMPVEAEKLLPGISHQFDMLKNMPNETIVRLYREMMKLASESLEGELASITDGIRSIVKFACFSECKNSNYMWGQYASNSTGFTLEYDFDLQSFAAPIDDEQETERHVGLALFPIMYRNQQIDATKYAEWNFQRRMLMKVAPPQMRQIIGLIFDDLNPSPDLFMGVKLALNKSTEWKSEKEWRLFLLDGSFDSLAPYISVKYKPSAVYIGRKISDINEKIITTIARSKGIPAFKMEIDPNSRNFKLVYKQII